MNAYSLITLQSASPGYAEFPITTGSASFGQIALPNVGERGETEKGTSKTENYHVLRATIHLLVVGNDNELDDGFSLPLLDSQELAPLSSYFIYIYMDPLVA